ncbi:MAG: AAA family ATPase [Desulfomonilaceae bacterium]
MLSTNLDDSIKEIKRKLLFPDLFREFYPSYWIAQGNCFCPWHEDQTPSLEVKSDRAICYGACSENGRGKAYDVFDLFQRRHQCDFKSAKESLAERVGIQIKSQGKSGGRIVATYPYQDEGGELLYQVVRYAPKNFRQRCPDGKRGWTWNLKNVRRVLFGLSELLASDKSQPVIVVEGEKDCLAARELGFTATCNPGGAGKWPGLVKQYSIHEPLKGRIVWIMPDNDEAGRKHAEDIARSLHGFAATVKIIQLPGLPEKGDFTDFAGLNGNDTRAKLIEIAESTPNYKPRQTGPEIISCKELIESEIEPPKWIIRDILPEGLGLLVAKPKAGKSWLCQNLSLSIAQGIKALGRFPTLKSTTLNLCLEDNRRRMRKRLSMMLKNDAPPDNHLIACVWPSFDKGGLDALHKILEDDPNIKLVTIDTFGRFRPRRNRTDDIYSSDYADLQQLHSLASLYELAILLVHHERKETSEDALDNILGSTAVSGAADSILILKRQSRINTGAVLYVSGRDIPDQEHALTFEDGIWTYAGNPLEINLTAERRQIRGAIKDAGTPLGPTQIAQLTGKKVSAIANLLSRMVDAGELRKSVSAGKYALPPEDELYGEPWKRSDKQYDEVYLDHM